jgi:hypothetical protein
VYYPIIVIKLYYLGILGSVLLMSRDRQGGFVLLVHIQTSLENCPDPRKNWCTIPYSIELFA